MNSAYTLEVCTQCVDDMACAIAAGANRFELCGDLSVGGVTPDLNDVRRAIQTCRAHGVPLMVMIRPRGGDFVYSRDEVQAMCDTIAVMKQLEVNGVVFGALTCRCDLDKPAIERLVCASLGLSRTFHMAFDHLKESEKISAIDYLVEQGFDRILTHGSRDVGQVEMNFPVLKKYVQHAGGRITIMPGGGVHFGNVASVASCLGVKELHGTRIVDFPRSSL